MLGKCIKIQIEVHYITNNYKSNLRDVIFDFWFMYCKDLNAFRSFQCDCEMQGKLSQVVILGKKAKI